MSPAELMQKLCCRRRAGSDGHGSAETRRERAARILESKRREIYERARERAKVAPSFIEDLGTSHLIVESRVCKDGQGRLEALATPPVTINFTLPEDYEPGKPVFVDGPHGRMQVAAPPSGKPGSVHHVRLGPPPEFRLGVPAGAKPGCELTFQRPDGMEISVPVPPGKQAGDAFDVPPPAMMVRVPEGAAAGDAVTFRAAGAGSDEAEVWCRAKVPEGAGPGCYFAARLPPPEGVAAKKPVVGSPVAAEAPLPKEPEPEWTEVTDPKSDKVYYWNKATGKTSWTNPLVEKVAKEKAVLDCIRQLEAAAAAPEAAGPQKVASTKGSGVHRRAKAKSRDA